jgi:hypothetical protein
MDNERERILQSWRNAWNKNQNLKEEIDKKLSTGFIGENEYEQQMSQYKLIRRDLHIKAKSLEIEYRAKFLRENGEIVGYQAVLKSFAKDGKLELPIVNEQKNE